MHFKSLPLQFNFRMKTRTATTYLLLVAGILVLTNILSESFFLRLDFTQDKRYTLSKVTKEILKDLDENVTVKAYFTEGLPPGVAKIKKDFNELLIEYATEADGKIDFKFINPNEDEKLEQEAYKAGIQPVILDVREKDQVKQQKAFLGAVIELGENKEILSVVQAGAAMEYALSSAIKKVSVKEKPLIGILQGHGEPSTFAMQQAMSELNVMYSAEHVNLNDSALDLNKYPTICIIAPKDSIPSEHFSMIDNYLDKGGNLIIAMNRVEGDLSRAMGNSVTNRMETWLAEKGLIVENNFVIDASCANVSVQQQQGQISFVSQVKFPYLPILTNFREHPITEGLEAVVFQFASTISYTGDSTNVFTPLVLTSEKTGTITAPTYFDISKQWTENDFPNKNLTVGGVLENNKTKSKIVLFGDGDFPVNGEGQSAQRLQADNVNLFVNSIDWLSDDTGLIELRTKAVTSRPIEQIDDAKKATYKWINFLLPLFIVIGYGIVRWQNNQKRRLKRMIEGQV